PGGERAPAKVVSVGTVAQRIRHYGRQPIEKVVAVGDRDCAAQPPRDYVGVGGVAQLLVIGRAARAGSLGRQREARLRQSVEPVIFVGSQVALGILQRRQRAVAVVGQRALV